MKHFFEFYNFKKLNKKRKIFFCCFWFFGLGEFILGIIGRNVAAITLGFMCIFETLDLFTSQQCFDLMDEYQNIFKKTNDCLKENLRTTIKILKSKDENLRKDCIKIIEEFLEKEEKNDIK